MPLLTVRNLSVSFATSTGPFKAVDGIDYAVDVGEVLAIVGESGSGKSVGMLAVMGLLPPTATVTMRGSRFARTRTLALVDTIVAPSTYARTWLLMAL